MKKLVLLTAVVGFSLASCSKKTGCPTGGASIGAERILAGDRDAVKAAKKAKYKGRKSF